MNPLITNMVLMLVVNRLSGKLDFEDPTTVNIVRGAYIASTLLVLIVYLVTRHLINKKNDLTTLRFQQPASAFSQEEPKMITTTVKAYDLEQVGSALKGVFMGIAMAAFMHLYKKSMTTLVLQSITPLKSVFDNKLIQIHLLGRSGPGYERPFKADDGLAGLFGKKGAEEPKPAAVKAKAE